MTSTIHQATSRKHAFLTECLSLKLVAVYWAGQYVNIWFERDPQYYDDDRPGIIGSELLINQCLFEEINKIYGSSPKTVKEIISN